MQIGERKASVATVTPAWLSCHHSHFTPSSHIYDCSKFHMFTSLLTTVVGRSLPLELECFHRHVV